MRGQMEVRWLRDGMFQVRIVLWRARFIGSGWWLVAVDPAKISDIQSSLQSRTLLGGTASVSRVE